MNRNLIGVFGFVLILLSFFLPFAGFEQSNGDILPLLVAAVSFLTGAGLLVYAIKPSAAKAYALSAAALCLVVFVLMAAGTFVSFGFHAI